MGTYHQHGKGLATLNHATRHLGTVLPSGILAHTLFTEECR